MASRASHIAIPTTFALLAHEDRLPSTSGVVLRCLHRLSRPALLGLVQKWLSDEYQTTCAPYLLPSNRPAERWLYPAMRTLEHLRDVYVEFRSRKGGKKEIVDRIVQGDWVCSV